jgi:hypothetical protein
MLKTRKEDYLDASSVAVVLVVVGPNPSMVGLRMPDDDDLETLTLNPALAIVYVPAVYSLEIGLPETGPPSLCN